MSPDERAGERAHDRPATPPPGDRLAATLARRDVQALAALVVAQALLVAGYFATTTARPTSLRYVWYPVGWITVAVWAVATRTPGSAGRRRRQAAAAVGVAYLLVVAAVGNVVMLSGPETGEQGARLIFASPGWGPMLHYVGPVVTVTAVPFRLAGYLALSYLVYAAAVDASGAVLSGALGVASCVSCSLPLVAALVAGVGGGTTGVAGVAYAYSLDISTLAFLGAVGGLYWGPAVGQAIARQRGS